MLLVRFIILFSFLILEVNYVISQNIPSYSVITNQTNSKGYYFFAAIKPGQKKPYYPAYHFIIDGKGDLVYCKEFPLGISPGDFKIHKNALMSYYYINKYMIMDSTFTIIDSVAIKNGYKEDGHELQILENGNYVLIGIDEVKADLTSINHFNKNNSFGNKNAMVRYSVVQEQDSNKNVVFEWHSKNYFNLNNIDSLYLNDVSKINVPHINSIASDKDGNFILSCRNFNEITKISRKNGSIIWRLGGQLNQFDFINDSSKFYAQHAAEIISDNNLIIYDNGYEFEIHPASCKEYFIDEKNFKVKLVWQYTENQNSFSTGLGNAQRILNGNTLISYGLTKYSNIMFNVVTNKQEKVFEIRFADTLRTYRAYYYPNLPFRLKRPEIRQVKLNGNLNLEADKTYTSILWQDGNANQRFIVTKPGTYYLSIPYGNGGRIYASPKTINYHLKNTKEKE